MPNAMQMATPEAPQDGNPPPATGNAMQGGLGATQAGGPPPPPQPMPTHAETVAALRHFHAISSELETILENPKAGKGDLKSEIIDSVTRLVSERVMSPAQAVMQLAGVPSEPPLQRKWLMDHLQNAEQAEVAVLHHRAMAAAGGQPDASEYNSDDHVNLMGGLAAKYAGGKRA